MEKITMSVKEIADYLGVSETTIYTMVRNSEIPHFKVRGRILFNRDVIIEWTRGEYRNHSTKKVVNT